MQINPATHSTAAWIWVIYNPAKYYSNVNKDCTTILAPAITIIPFPTLCSMVIGYYTGSILFMRNGAPLFEILGQKGKVSAVFFPDQTE